jgi:hypothetical protein
MKNTLTPEATVGIASLLSIVLTSFAAIGAPPSHVDEHAGAWLLLDPLMIPCLVCAPLLCVAALMVGAFSPRMSGALCVLGLAGSWIGVMIASGLERGVSASGALISLCIWSIPAYIAIDGVRHSGRERESVGAG